MPKFWRIWFTNSYLKTRIEGKSYPDPLLFWKCQESQFAQIAKLAKKYLAVPASSPAVEWVFSFYDHILRSKPSPYFFSSLFF